MPVNRWTPAVSVLALCLGLVLIVGSRPAPPAAVLPPAVAAVTTSPAPSSSLSPTDPTATGVPAIPPGYRIKIPRLAIDPPLAGGDIESDTEGQQTPESLACHLPGRALAGGPA